MRSGAGAVVVAAALLVAGCGPSKVDTSPPPSATVSTGGTEPDAGTGTGADTTTTGQPTGDGVDGTDPSGDVTDDASPDVPDLPSPPNEEPIEISRGFVPDPIDWSPLNDAVDTATVSVPVDYADVDGARFDLFVARYRALDPEQRIGSLFVNPGGPGFGGSDYAIYASDVFDRRVLERFDIIGWDPRGTGESDPAIDCVDDLDPFVTAVDSAPDDPAEADELEQAQRDLAAACVGRTGDAIRHVGTNNSARDVDVIRRALGEEQISYFGFSYGSELGAVWATLFPETVRAAVFDGAVDPTATSAEATKAQYEGFDAALRRFLADCSADQACAFHSDGDAAGALDALLAELDAAPIQVTDERPPVNRDVATTAIIRSMYADRYWPALERSLAEARDGSAAGLLALHDLYYQRAGDGTWGDEIEAFIAISCADDPERPTPAELAAQVAELTLISPRLVPPGSQTYGCSFFPEPIDPRLEVSTDGAVPIVVIATTGDPATPYESSQRMVAALGDGRLVSVDADQHTGYGVNRCVVEVVNDYLVDLDPPADGITCE